MAKAKKSDDSILSTLQERFEKNASRHEGVKWEAVAKKLDAAKLAAVTEMERTGGEPDVVDLNGVLVFCDCAAESPKDRRSVCYDGEALRSRKENKPKTSALELAAKLGIEVLDEAQYAALQKVGPFDEKTSSWLKTPPEVRKLGGALFGDHRFGRTFTYHNGAESYYAARGFRGFVRL
ncbi:MAG: DUF4256 domain-containing protein [Archangium sp.]